MALGESFGGQRGDQDAGRRGGEDQTGFDRVVSAYDLEIHRYDKRDTHQDQPLDVLRAQGEVRGSVLEQAHAQQRLGPPAFERADVPEEPERQTGGEHGEHRNEQPVHADLKNRDHEEEHPGRRERGAGNVEAPGPIRRQRIDDATRKQHDQRHDRRLRPKISVSLLPGIINAAIHSRNSVIAVCTPCTVVPRSLLMLLIDTFMLDPAKLATNCVAPAGPASAEARPRGVSYRPRQVGVAPAPGHQYGS
jgi:hypothetical protein